MVNWYHTYLLRTGTERTEATINQHYYCPNLSKDIGNHIKVFNTCQKERRKKYGNLPAK